MCQVKWAVCVEGGAVGGEIGDVAGRQAALIGTQPESGPGDRGVPLLCALIYGRPLWHAPDLYQCGKD